MDDGCLLQNSRTTGIRQVGAIEPFPFRIISRYFSQEKREERPGLGHFSIFQNFPSIIGKYCSKFLLLSPALVSARRLFSAVLAL